MVRRIDRALLAEVAKEAASSPRLRKNRNFHGTDDHPAHRLLNALEPGSYVPPHRHLDTDKDETLVCLQGRLGLLVFDAEGAVVDRMIAGPGEPLLGVDIPHGTFHACLALDPGTVFFEAKAGPFRPLTSEERASWAPLEGEPGAEAYREALAAALRGA